LIFAGLRCAALIKSLHSPFEGSILLLHLKAPVVVDFRENACHDAAPHCWWSFERFYK